MEIRLTAEGRKLLNKEAICSVSTDRAYAMMEGGFAVKDNGFMRLYVADIPESKMQAAAKAKKDAGAKKEAEAEAKKEAAAKKKADAKAKKEAEAEKAKKKDE